MILTKEMFQNKKLIIKKIINESCKFYSFPIGRLNEPNHKHEVTEVRQLIAYLLREIFEKKITLSYIGGLLRDDIPLNHTTIIHSIRTVNNLKDTDRQFAYDLKILIRDIEAYIMNFNTLPLSKYVANIMKDMHLSIYTLSRLSGIPKIYICEFFRGTRDVDINFIMAFHDILGINGELMLEIIKKQKSDE